MDPTFTIDDEGEAQPSMKKKSDQDVEQPSSTASQHIADADSNDSESEREFTTEPSGAIVQPQKPDSFRMIVAGRTIQLEFRIIPIVAQYVAAMIVLIALTVQTFHRTIETNYVYGIIFASVAMAFSLVGTLCHYTAPDVMGRRLPGSSTILQSLTYSAVFSIVLWIWWLVGVGILTFRGPFLVSSNGYFACWAGLGFATKALFNDLDSTGWIDGLLYGTELYKDVFLAALFVLLCALPRHIGKSADYITTYEGEAIYALVVVLLTLPILSTSRFSSMTLPPCCGREDLLSSIIWGVLAILWLVLACLVTFRGPFGPQATGNGYFASWIGLFCCLAVTIGGNITIDRDESSTEANLPNRRRQSPNNPKRIEPIETPPPSPSQADETNSRGTTIVASSPRIGRRKLRMPEFSSSTSQGTADAQSSVGNEYNGPAEV